MTRQSRQTWSLGLVRICPDDVGGAEMPPPQRRDGQPGALHDLLDRAVPPAAPLARVLVPGMYGCVMYGGMAQHRREGWGRRVGEKGGATEAGRTTKAPGLGQQPRKARARQRIGTSTRGRVMGGGGTGRVQRGRGGLSDRVEGIRGARWLIRTRRHQATHSGIRSFLERLFRGSDRCKR